MPNRFLIGAAQGLGKADIVGEMRRKEDMLEQRRREAIASQEAMRRNAYQQERDAYQKEQDDKKYQLETQKQTDLNTYRNNVLTQRDDQQIARQEQMRFKNPEAFMTEEEKQQQSVRNVLAKSALAKGYALNEETGKMISLKKNMPETISIFGAVADKVAEYKNSNFFTKKSNYFTGNFSPELLKLKSKGDYIKAENIDVVLQSQPFQDELKQRIKDPKKREKAISEIRAVVKESDKITISIADNLVQEYQIRGYKQNLEDMKNVVRNQLLSPDPEEGIISLYETVHAIGKNPLSPTEYRKLIKKYGEEEALQIAQKSAQNQQQQIQQQQIQQQQTQQQPNIQNELLNQIGEDQNLEEGGDIPQNLNQNEPNITPEREQEINNEIQNAEVEQQPEEETILERVFNERKKAKETGNIIDQQISSSVQQAINKYKNSPQFRDEFQDALIKTPVALQVIGQGAKDIARDIADLIDEGHPEVKELLFGANDEVKQFESDHNILSRILKAAPELAAYEAGVGLLGKATKLFRAGKQFANANPILNRVLNNTVYESARTALHEKDNRMTGAMKGALQGAVFGTLGEGIAAPLRKAPKLATKAGAMLEEGVASEKLSLFKKKNEVNAIENVDELKQLKQQEKEFQGKDLKAESKSFLKEKFGIDLNKNANKAIAEDFKTQGIKNLEKAETGYGEIAENIGKKAIPLMEKIGIKADIQDKAKKIIKSALEEGKAQTDIDKFTKKINKVETYQDLQDFVHGANKYFSEGERSAYQQILKEIKPVIEKRLDKVTEGKFSQSQKEYSNFKIAKEEIGIDKATIDAFERGELSQKDLFNKINSKHSDQIEKLILHPDKQNFKFLGEGGLKALAEKRLNELITKDPKTAPAKFQEFLQDIGERLDDHPKLQVSLGKQAKEYEKFINQTEKEGSKLSEMLERAKIKEGQSSFENEILKKSPEELSLMRDKLKAEIKNIEQYLEDPDTIKNFIAKARGDKELGWKDYLGNVVGMGVVGASPVYNVVKIYQFSKKLTENIAKADIQGLTSTTRQILTILNKNFAKISSSLLNSTSKKEGR
jgi:hypothetical protein